MASVRDSNILHYIDCGSKDVRPAPEPCCCASQVYLSQVMEVNMNPNQDNWVSFTAMDLAISPDNKYLLVATGEQDKIDLVVPISAAALQTQARYCCTSLGARISFADSMVQRTTYTVTHGVLGIQTTTIYIVQLRYLATRLHRK